MIATIDGFARPLAIDFSAGVSLAIPLDPNGPQPSFFAGDRAHARPLKNGDYIGDVAQGGSCNADVLEFTPHCHGTHTECVAHLDRSAGHVLDIIDQRPCLACLVTLEGTPPASSEEHYPVELDDAERLLTRRELEEKLAAVEIPGALALVVRTLPNPPAKKFRDYATEPAYPLFSTEAMEWLAGSQFMHLLVDTPSLDRAQDGGKLSNHRHWWGLEGAPDNTPEPWRRSVTEMIFVPGSQGDGLYWLQLGLQPLMADATSSQPVLYPVTENSP